MCSRGSDDEGDALMTPVTPTDSSCSTCRKCNESPANVVLQNKFPYCRNCFIIMVSHKYRSTLGKSKLMKHGDRVLIAYSGSSASSSLLHMIKMSALDGKKKKIKTTSVVLFVDDMIPSIVDNDDRSRIIREIDESLSDYDYEKFYVRLDSIFDDSPTIVPLTSEVEPMSNLKLQNLIKCCKSPTSVTDLLRRLRYNLFYLAAKQLNCNKVFLAETSDDLAVNIISNVALGRGAQLPLDVGFKDGRFEGVDFLRPLQEISKKEAAFYNAFNHLRPVTVPNNDTKTSKLDTIQKLTEDFITNLGISFPSTVHTVVATGSKLLLNEENTRGVCGLCKGLVDVDGSNSLSSSSATKLSGLVSLLGPNQFDSSSLSPAYQNDCPAICSPTKCCSSKNEGKITQDTRQSFCYGCQLIKNEFDHLDLWPPAIRKAVEDESMMSAMREEIKDFLL